MNIETILKPQQLNEISMAIFPKKLTFLFHGGELFLIIYAIYLGWNTNIATRIVIMIIIVIGCLCLELLLKHRKKKFSRITYERWKENCPQDEMIYSFTFNDDSVHIKNLTNQGQQDISYDVFQRYIETNHFVILLTKAYQYIVIDKNHALEHDLKNFILNKNKNIKTK